MAIEHTDFLALEDLIIAQIEQANINGIKKVYGGQDLATVTTNNQIAPSVAVVYHRYSVQATDERRQRAVVKQFFYTVLTVRNSRDQVHTKGVRDAAGPLMMQLINLLKGWEPGVGYSKLKIENGAPAARGKSVTDFPIGWSCEMYI